MKTPLWIIFKKNPITDRVIYSLPKIEGVQSAPYEKFYIYLKDNFEIEDLTELIKVINSHTLVKLEKGKIEILKEHTSSSGMLEEELKNERTKKISSEKNYRVDNIISNTKKIIDKYVSSPIWKK